LPVSIIVQIRVKHRFTRLLDSNRTPELQPRFA
jgi:hypothetical protein